MAAKSESLETRTYTSASSRLASKIMQDARFTSDPFSSVFRTRTRIISPFSSKVIGMAGSKRQSWRNWPSWTVTFGLGLKRANVSLLPYGRLRVGTEERLNQRGEISDALDVVSGKKFREQRLKIKPLDVRRVLEILPVHVEPVDVNVRLGPV